MSSHLLAEVSQTVDHVVILDKGRLIVSDPLSELTARSRSAVVVRSPEADRLRMELTKRGIDAAVTGPDEVTATGTSPEAVGGVIGAIGLHHLPDAARRVEPRRRLLLHFTNTEGAMS